MKTRNLYKTLVGLSTAATLSLVNPSNLYSQQIPTTDKTEIGVLEKLTQDKNILIQRGIQQGSNFEEKGDSITFEYNFNTHLQDALNNASKPYLYLSGVNGSIRTNDEKSKLYVTISKNDLGKQVAIGVGDRDGTITPCDEDGLGRKSTSLASLWTYLNYQGINGQDTIRSSQPTQGQLTQPVPQPTPSGETPFQIILDLSDKSINTINNYYYQIQDTVKADTAKVDTTQNFRVLTEAGYGTGTQFTGMVSPQWKILKNIFVGPYLEANSFKRNETFLTPVDKTDAIIPNFLYSRTQGTMTDNSDLSKPYGFGLLFSANAVNEKMMFNLGLGALKINSSQGKRIHEGIDQVLQNNEVLETKNYFYETGEPIKESEFVPVIKGSANFSPLKGNLKNAYVGTEIQHSLKTKSDKFKHSSVNAKIGWKFNNNRRK